MTTKECLELSRLSKKWVLGKASMGEMLRCLALSRKAKKENQP